MTRRKGALSLGSGCDKRQAGNGLRGQSGKQGSVCDRGAEGAAAGNCCSFSIMTRRSGREDELQLGWTCRRVLISAPAHLVLRAGSLFFFFKWDSKQDQSGRRFGRSFDPQVKACRLRMGEVPTTIFIPRMHVPVMHNFFVQLVSTLRGESSMQLRVLDVKVARNQNAENRYVKGRCRVAEFCTESAGGKVLL
jgi:hypothetical protein